MCVQTRISTSGFRWDRAEVWMSQGGENGDGSFCSFCEEVSMRCRDSDERCLRVALDAFRY